MTFALEPKLVYENEFAAGVESVFLVTENRCATDQQGTGGDIYLLIWCL